MKYLTVALFTIFSLALVNAQDDEKVINSILYELIEPSLLKYNNDTLLINSKIYKTRFEYDSISFEKETGLRIPKKIISEFKDNVEKNKIVGLWNSTKFNRKDTIFLEKDTIIGKKPFIKCLSDYETKTLFKKNKKRQRILSISKLIYDKNKENAIFNLCYNLFPGDISGHTILISKIYGKWIIVSRFDYFMS